MDRTNVTDKGYTYNGQNYTNQTRTDSQGNQYTVAIPTAISASSLQTPQASLPITQPQYNTATQQSQIGQASAYVNNAYNTAQSQADQALQAQQDAYKNANTDVALLQSQMGGKGQDLVNAYNQQDQTGQSVNTLAAKLRQLNAQSQALGLDTMAKQQQEINNATGQNITQAAVQRNTADATRQNLIDTARIAMESAIVKADYDTAKSYADQMVQAKYDQKLADIEAAKTNLESIKYSLTSAEKKVAEATAQRLEKEKRDYEKKMADEQAVSNIGVTLRKYGVSDSIVKDVLSSKSINEALIKAGNNLQDPKALAEIKQINAEVRLKNAQADKLDREAQLTKEPSATEKKAAALAVTQAKSSAQAAHDKIETIDNILTYDAGISSRVGPNILSRGITGPAIGGAATGAAAASVIPGVGTLVGGAVGGILGAGKGIGAAVSGQGQQLSGAVHQLTAGLTLKELQDAKANGATFGSLTDGERNMLAAAATKLNDWEIKDDKGNPTGYWNIDESSFRQELKTIQELNKKALLKSQGTLISSDESSQLDSLFTPEQPSASQYY